MRHVIARDASPYVASLLEISGFSQGSIRERRSLGSASACQRLPPRRRQYGVGLIRNHRPQSDAPRAIQRMSPLQTSDSIARHIVMRQLPQSLESGFILPICNHLGRSSRPAQTSFLILLSTQFPSPQQFTSGQPKSDKTLKCPVCRERQAKARCLKRVNLCFELPYAVKYFGERRLVSKNHVMHMPVIVSQNPDRMLRRHQLNFFTGCTFVMRP